MAAQHAGYRLYQDLAAWWPLISPPEEYAEVAGEYSADEIAALVGLLVAINAWNTVGVSTRTWVPGTYQL